MAGERVDAIARGALSEDALEPHERASRRRDRERARARIGDGRIAGVGRGDVVATAGPATGSLTLTTCHHDQRQKCPHARI